MFYSMLAYKLKVMHVEDATLIFSPIRKNTISYPSEDKKLVVIPAWFLHMMGSYVVMSSQK